MTHAETVRQVSWIESLIHSDRREAQVVQVQQARPPPWLDRRMQLRDEAHRAQPCDPAIDRRAAQQSVKLDEQRNVGEQYADQRLHGLELGNGVLVRCLLRIPPTEQDMRDGPVFHGVWP